ncbi:MAG TPA: lipoyl(octanoyl) transferase LipB [Bacteroidetes bacterium]|nr:lipoyl(octanoyl) transferase LipB [Bacteroidota bacterium]
MNESVNTNPEANGIPVRFIDLGILDYQQAWDLQEKYFEEVTGAKLDHREGIKPNYLLFVEHPHVYTLGKSGSEQNLLIDHIQLQAREASFYRINRGGDITYHGPGQIVGYPILDLEDFGLHARSYIALLEEAVIRTLGRYGIGAGRLPGATGVWLDSGDKAKARKICAIGVRLSRFVSMHGFAFNVNTQLEYFGYINPCGYTDKGVTSMKNELGSEVDMPEVKTILREEMARLFKMKFVL